MIDLAHQDVGQKLLTAGMITQHELDICKAQRNRFAELGTPVYLESILVQNRFVSQSDISRVQVAEAGPASFFTQLVPLNLCKALQIFPVRATGSSLEILSARPLSEKNILHIRQSMLHAISDIKIKPCDAQEIKRLLRGAIDTDHSFASILETLKVSEVSGSSLRHAINALFLEAIDQRASDLHIDNKPDPEAWISFRIDGSLKFRHLVPARLMAALFTKLKTDAGMDASDVRRSQDGRFFIENNGNRIEFRVATQPLINGETMTIRILDPSKILAIPDLFPHQPEMIAAFDRISEIRIKEGGLILISGPTGHGKTSTLYSAVQSLNRSEINVVTVEDPVEFTLPLVRQIQVNQLLNEKTSSMERSLLRQDPDVIVNGEVRDRDTMEAALQFAQSGHYALGSIHADNALDSLVRILAFIEGDMKEQAIHMLANTLHMIVNQKLARRLCNCSTVIDSRDIEGIAATVKKHGVSVSSWEKVRQKVGCPACDFTGYRGRIAAHETLIFSKDRDKRSELAGLLQRGPSHQNDLLNSPGVTFFSRARTVGVLFEHGFIDLPTVGDILREDLA